MIQAKTQTAEYWHAEFSITDADIEQIYNHFLEIEMPQTVDQLAAVIVNHRVHQEINGIKQQMKGHAVYQPQESYAVDDKVVFPAMQFARGAVTAVRAGYNPEFGKFNVVSVPLDKKVHEFASDFTSEHTLNAEDGEEIITSLLSVDSDAIYQQYGQVVVGKITEALVAQSDFIKLRNEWFTKSLMADISVGHLHLSEAILEINEGGPLSVDELLPDLDLGKGVKTEIQRFSLNHSLLNDARFDEVAPGNEVAWFLKRLEPDDVKQTPERLKYTPIPYEQSQLSPGFQLLEQELDDEWSDFSSGSMSQPAIFSLTYPHKWAGTIPLSSRIRPLFPLGNSPRQRIVFLDEHSGDEIEGWIVQENRYVSGLKEWYTTHDIPIGGFLHLSPGPKPGVIKLGFDRRKPKREWVRLATVQDNRLQFDLKRRSVGCGYDDLLIVGTDVVAAVDALWRRVETNNYDLGSILVQLFPSLADLTPQRTVHAKTLYSAVNMLKRIPPGPIFAELMANPLFSTVGDHYWTYEKLS